jgi:DAK2 domain fusion protein YloV
MTAPTKLSPTDVRTAITTFAVLLRSHREVINRLNVYPVPDGDTGTNMTLTVESVVAAFGPDAGEPTMESVCQAIANGSLMGARGNSGVILSQLLRGLVERWRAVVAVTPTLLAESLSRADQLAREAVVRPAEGTILSVAHAAAQGAADATDSLTHLVRSARDRARVALARTPDQLAVLKQAGVVDSGGTGLVLLFDALCHVVAGDPLPVAPPADTIHIHVSEEVVAHPDDAVGQLRYEVMYLLEAPDATMSAFREVWSGLGDSIAIVGGDGLYNCHIHTNDIGASIEAGLDAGRPRNIRVTDLAEQVIEERWVREATVVGPLAGDGVAPTTSVVAVVVGDGVARIFRSLGVRAVVAGGQSMNPSTEEMVAAVRAVGSAQVVILPNNANIRPVAEQVAGLVDGTVRVVPTASIVEGFAALLAYDPAADADHNAIAMAASAAHVMAGEVTRAVRDTWTDVGEVHAGDWIGLSARGVRAVSESVAGAATALLADLVTPQAELVTIIEGDGSSAANTRRITEFLGERYPSLAVEVHHGGQPLYPYYVGVE